MSTGFSSTLVEVVDLVDLVSKFLASTLFVSDELEARSCFETSSVFTVLSTALC